MKRYIYPIVENKSGSFYGTHTNVNRKDGVIARFNTLLESRVSGAKNIGASIEHKIAIYKPAFNGDAIARLYVF